MKYLQIDTPLGSLVLVSNDGGLQNVFFTDRPGLPLLGATEATPEDPLMKCARGALASYFMGQTRISGIPIMPSGTDFQLAVWRAVSLIKPGRTVSYTELARMVGRPDAVRAVAHAVARNPIVIFVPCHRVIGANGCLVGYSAGVTRKQQLLTLEGATFNMLQQ